MSIHIWWLTQANISLKLIPDMMKVQSTKNQTIITLRLFVELGLVA
jgi:hypothetical protein